ncbi:hypothetical protein HDU76_012238 [Blyttiomyces sp. JEL0837]|nr:hypothetical protein HDU76_012238 [Blyttiomyces sp. JEL0837]
MRSRSPKVLIAGAFALLTSCASAYNDFGFIHNEASLAANPSIAKRYHLGDQDSHCWINKTLSLCPSGVDMQWITIPPVKITSSTPIIGTYALVQGSITPITPPLIAHANFHACPTDIGFCDVNVKNGTISPSGALVSQEAAQTSNSSVITSKLILKPGSWCIVAHLRIFYKDANNGTTQLDVARAVYRTITLATCPPGSFKTGTSDSGDALCSLCSIGTYSTSTDATSCTLCPVGTYQNNVGATSCITCPPGYYQDSPGDGSCMACPAFTYSFANGSRTGCSLCPHGAYTKGAAASLSDCVCQAGFYSGVDGSCTECPPTGYCCTCDPDPKKSWQIITTNLKNNRPACETCLNGSSLPIPQPGYTFADETNLDFYSCNPSSACLGGPRGVPQCADGYDDQRCGHCTAGYYIGIDGDCAKCDGTGTSFLLLFAFLVALATVFYSTLIFVCAEECTDAGAVLLTYFQVLDLARRYRSIWPKHVSTLLYIAALFNIDLTFFKLDCFVQMPYWAQQMLWLISPLLVVFLIMITYVVVKVLRAKWSHLIRSKPISWGPGRPYPFTIRNPFLKLFEVPDDELFRIFLSWMIFCAFPIYPMMVSRSLLPFNCGVVLDNAQYSVSFLKERREVKCDWENFQTSAGPTILSLVVWCILPPLTSFIFIIYAKLKGYTKDEKFYQIFWPIYLPYKGAAVFWISLQLMLVYLFHSTAVAFKTDNSQMIAGTLILLLELVLVAYIRPWTENFIAYLDFLAHSSLIIFLIFARELNDENMDIYDPVLTALLSVTVIIIASLLIYNFVSPLLPAKYRLRFAYHKNIVETVSKIQHEMPKDKYATAEEKGPLNMHSLREESRKNSISLHNSVRVAEIDSDED